MFLTADPRVSNFEKNIGMRKNSLASICFGQSCEYVFEGGFVSKCYFVFLRKCRTPGLGCLIVLTCKL